VCLEERRHSTKGTLVVLKSKKRMVQLEELLLERDGCYRVIVRVRGREEERGLFIIYTGLSYI